VTRVRADDSKVLGFVLALLCLLSATASGAAEINVFSAGAVEPGLLELAPLWNRETGHVARLTVAVPAVLRQRVEAGETPDVLIAPPAVVDPLVTAGKASADGRARVGRAGVGIVVRTGAPAPDISSTDRFKEALLASDAVVYNRASTGTYFERLLERLRLADAIKAKAVRESDGAAVMTRVARGTGREIGVGPITEIRAFEAKGIRLVGPLPPDIQNYTAYDAVVLTSAKSLDLGRAFVQFITSASARAKFTATGLD